MMTPRRGAKLQVPSCDLPNVEEAGGVAASYAREGIK